MLSLLIPNLPQRWRMLGTGYFLAVIFILAVDSVKFRKLKKNTSTFSTPFHHRHCPRLRYWQTGLLMSASICMQSAKLSFDLKIGQKMGKNCRLTQAIGLPNSAPPLMDTAAIARRPLDNRTNSNNYTNIAVHWVHSLAEKYGVLFMQNMWIGCAIFYNGMKQ